MVGIKYIAQLGDTLGTIAGKYDTTVQAIVQTNGMRNPDMIHLGQILRVPTHPTTIKIIMDTNIIAID